MQASRPSSHVWSFGTGSSSCPQFLNQAPPEAQQLSLPDLVLMPHLGHAGALVITLVGASIVVVEASVEVVRASVVVVGASVVVVGGSVVVERVAAVETGIWGLLSK